MTQTLRQFAESEIPLAIDRFHLYPIGDFQPTFVGVTKGGNRLPLPAHWSNNRQKDIYAMLTRATFKAIGVTRYALVSEVWIAVEPGDKDHPPDMNNMIPPSQRPDRTEAIMIQAFDKGAMKSVSVIIPITRDSDGKPTLGEPKTEEMELTTGRFANLLEDVQ